MKRKYNGNENGHIQIYQSPFRIFSFPFSFPVKESKFFPLTDISVSVSVYHTEACHITVLSTFSFSTAVHADYCMVLLTSDKFLLLLPESDTPRDQQPRRRTRAKSAILQAVEDKVSVLDKMRGTRSEEASLYSREHELDEDERQEAAEEAEDANDEEKEEGKEEEEVEEEQLIEYSCCSRCQYSYIVCRFLL